MDTPVALSPPGEGELASGPTSTVRGAGETLPNRKPRHAPPRSSLCPALPWVEQGRARRQSRLGPGAWRCAPPDPVRKESHRLQEETLGCPCSPCCPVRGPRAQGQRGQASPSFKGGAEPPQGRALLAGARPPLSTSQPPRGAPHTRLSHRGGGGAAWAGRAGVETLGHFQLPGAPGSLGSGHVLPVSASNVMHPPLCLFLLWVSSEDTCH